MTQTPETAIAPDNSSSAVNVTKKGKTHQERRPREFLTPDEVERLEKSAALCARNDASRVRNRLMVRMAFRHGYRVNELCNLNWGLIDLPNRKLFVVRSKNGNNSTHPLLEDELRLLSRLRKLSKDRGVSSNYVFVSEEGFKLAECSVRKIIKIAGEKAGFSFPIHPHMLRHACGYYLAEKGTDTRTIQDYLGHRNISQTVRYTQGTSARFENLFT